MLFLHQVSLKLWLVVFLASSRNSGYEQISVACHNLIANLTHSLSAAKIYMVKKVMLVLPDQRLS